VRYFDGAIISRGNPVAKRALDLPFPAVSLDTSSAEPLHRQLYFGVREAILDGRLRPGLRLPSSRILAREIGVSRNTVLAAFEQLSAEGYLDGRVGAGSFVSRRLPEEALLARVPGHRRAGEPARAPGPSRRGVQLASLGHGLGRPRPFAPGLPELERFPFEEWSKLLARRWRTPKREFLVGGAPAGYRPLREAIADYLSSARAVACHAEQVIVTSGTQQALDLATRVLIDPGDPIWVEEPGYPATAAALTAAGARLVAVPVDGEGLSVAAGRAAEPAARMVCISPSHQFPLGVTMSLQRRLELLEWARAADGFVLEDDYDSEYRYAGRPLAALQGLDHDGRVIYLGTFSKVMFPGLRIGYMVVPEHLVDPFLAVRGLIDAHPSSIAQAALADFIAAGHMAAHIRRMRVLYGARQAALLEALGARLGGLLRLEAAAAGMHLVGRLAAGLEDVAIARAARAAGVEAPALSGYYRTEPAAQGLVLGYAGVPERDLLPAVERLARVLEGAAGEMRPQAAERYREAMGFASSSHPT
jgi:GntR family transcriptional regulator/MocR family aminotransferase